MRWGAERWSGAGRAQGGTAGGAGAHLARHHLEELGELDVARAVGVDVGDHLLELLLLHLEAERAHRRLELAVVDRARVVGVEEVERLADLLDLLLRETGLLLLRASGGAAHL